MTEGMDVVGAIAGVDTRPQGSDQDAPVTPVVINAITAQ